LAQHAGHLWLDHDDRARVQSIRVDPLLLPPPDPALDVHHRAAWTTVALDRPAHRHRHRPCGNASIESGARSPRWTGVIADSRQPHSVGRAAVLDPFGAYRAP